MIDRTASTDAGRTGLISGVVELTLETNGLEAMEQFYRELLGLPLLSRENDRIWLALGPRARLGLWAPGEKEFDDRGGRHVHFAVSVSPNRLDALHERLIAAGVEVRGPVEPAGGARSVYFDDPAGNRVEAWDFFEHGEGARDGVAAFA